MESILGHNSLRQGAEEKRNQIKADIYAKEVLEDIREVNRQLQEIEVRFNLASDSDLIESLIYEERALRARYTYLLRLAKAKGVTAEKSIKF